MFGSLTNFEGSLFDDLRRMQRDMDEMFGPRGYPTGIRSVARGTYPPINVGATSDRVDVYLFAAGLDPKALDIAIQQNLLTRDLVAGGCGSGEGRRALCRRRIAHCNPAARGFQAAPDRNQVIGRYGRNERENRRQESPVHTGT